MPDPWDWAWAFSLTIGVELPIVWALAGRGALPRAALANTLTHPTLWFLFPRFAPYVLWVMVAELWVWLVEALLYREVSDRPWELALIANAATTALGLLLAMRG
jgi:hypothetical protein